MLLPSGRSNSDVHPLQSTQKVPFLTRTSSPQLSLAPAPATAQQQQQQQLKPHQYQQQQLHQQQATATATAATTTTIATIAENGFTLSTATTTTATTSPGSQSETGTDRISTAATTKTTATTTATPYPMTFLGYNNNSNSNANNSNNNSCSSSETTTPLIKTSQPPALPLSEAAATTTTKAATSTTTTGTTAATTAAAALLATSGNWEEIDRHLEALQSRLKEGWTVHVGKDGRLYYCNHLTQTAGWLPSCEDWSRSEQLPYGWERAIDSKGRSYYINHINKTSTYEAPESVRWDENPPEPRVAVLERSPTLGFGFVAGSERPVIVRFVTDGGPSMNKLQPGDQILAVNGEDVKEAPRDHVIQLVRACEAQVTLLVCQPAHTFVPGRKSTLLSAGKRAKLRSRPSRVRFAESVCVNGAPLFPPSAFSLGDICVPPMANVLKVFLENGQTKSFKYDATTTVQDVVTSLLDKLCLATGELCSLVLEHVKSLRRNKLTLLDPEESLARIAARPGAHKLRCLFRVTFVPISAAELAQRDLNALDYLYMQCCNDVTQERFAPELQPEVALRLAALHMHQHALANNVSPSKLTVKIVEREFGLERFVPASLFEGMKRKELRRLVSHFLKLNAEMTGSSAKVLTQLQAKLHYLDIIAGLPSYGAKCFSTNQREGVERVLLVSPRFGLSQISSVRNSVPQPISAIEDFSHVIVRREDDVTCSVAIFMLGERVIKFSMEDRDACEFSLVLAGYYRLMTGQELPVDREREQFDEDNSPSYLAQHTVLPAAWSYLQPFHNRAHSINFLMSPPYHAVPLQLAKDAGGDQRQCDRNMNSPQVANGNHRQQRPGAKPMKLAFLGSAASTDLDMHSVMATELLEEAKDSGLSDSSGGGSASGLPASHYYSDRAPNGDGGGGVGGGNAFLEAKNEEVLRRVQEMQKMVESSEQYLTEQGEQVAPEEAWQQLQHQPLQRRTWQNESVNSGGSTSTSTNGQSAAGGIGPGQGQGLEFDSDCDSLNSSKVSSNEETPQPGALKHSDSLVLLAEAINQDLTGITKGLNSIGGAAMAAAELGGAASPAPGQGPGLSISAASSPRPERRLNGFGQLLSNLQALGNDYSQSESDSESVHSPTSSPTTRRPSLLTPTAGGARKQNVAYRSSFGLHSPDGSHFGPETKDYNLKEYLKQLKEISNVEEAAAGGEPGPDTAGAAARKLSEIYGFEIREDTFIETDSDLIDLRAIPPPQTPDELDALSLLNAPPQGFDDGSSASRRSAASASASASVSASQAAPPETEADLDRFLAKVVVAPPTQKATPAKELTPEEIMSFIIPPPPNLEDAERTRQQERDKGYGQTDESLYSNSQTMKGAAEPGSQPEEAARVAESETRHHAAVGHVIEYATVERKSKFSCCPKSRKEEPPPPPLAEDCVDAAPTPGLELPPRRGRGADEGAPPPLRPPKSAELLSRYSPKKQLSQQSSQPPPRQPPPPEGAEGPPTLPPRSSPSQRPPPEEQQRSQSPAVSPAPKKPPLPPFASRPVLPRGVGSASATAPFPNGSIGPGATQQHQQPQSPPPPLRHAYQTNGLLQTNTSTSTSSTLHSPHSNGLHLHQHQLQQQPPYHHRQRSNSDCPPAGPQTPPPLPPEKRPPLSLLCSPQMPRKAQPQPQTQSQSQAHSQGQAAGASGALIIKNGHVIDGEALLAKTDVAMAGLLVKLDQVAAQCSAAQAAGGGASINEEKFQMARNELTEQTLALVTASKYLVVSMSDMKLATLPEHLTSCLTAIRRITELTQDMTRHTSAPLQTRNIVLKVHDVASSFRELVGVQVGPLGAGQLALQAECLANVLATLLRSLRVFSP